MKNKKGSKPATLIPASSNLTASEIRFKSIGFKAEEEILYVIVVTMKLTTSTTFRITENAIHCLQDAKQEAISSWSLNYHQKVKTTAAPQSFFLTKPLFQTYETVEKKCKSTFRPYQPYNTFWQAAKNNF